MSGAHALGSITASLIILNTCWAALVVWASVMGYTQFVFTHDISGLSYVISALLVVAIAAAFMGRVNFLPHTKIWFVMLGLIGNLIGFIVALQGMSGGSLTDAAGLMRLATALLDGMSVAFCSTLAGAIAALWTSTNAWLLGLDAGE
ncbi:hypothetical protein J0664_06170 [Rhizobium leguminosarum]|uniref:hypothetical protein n=1 Tax=Rhizobium leguminosarum TaxID=384 RepID=UPI001A932B1B|nr:hypothetical protein [Rhizobium leguminosarum]MBY5553703.1 MotA/TolQ/ExbB proton channel family protein [Rhizobium leguminosarum]QSW24882.1 hypothetical protein J0664_06170 [Rhizobium leguminosarum]